MRSLSRTQKIILAVLAILDVIVIMGLGAIVVTTIRRMPALPTPEPTAIATATVESPQTWTPTVPVTPSPTPPPRFTNTPAPTKTPFPTKTSTPTMTPTPQPTSGPIPIEGGGFDFLQVNRIPGWTWDAYINFKPGDELDPENSFAEPMFNDADDPLRQIDGSTLKVETIRWLRFRTWVHQTVSVTVGTPVQFSIKASAFSSLDRLIVKAGIDPTGQEHCYNALWGNAQQINQDSGVVLIKSPSVVVLPPEKDDEATPTPTSTPDPREPDLEATPTDEITENWGQVTICFFAEPSYAHVNNAAFFDQAELMAYPNR